MEQLFEFIIKTGHYLHVTDNNAPLSEQEYTFEVSCNETRGLLGDDTYEFRLRTVLKNLILKMIYL